MGKTFSFRLVYPKCGNPVIDLVFTGTCTHLGATEGAEAEQADHGGGRRRADLHNIGAVVRLL